ncbi:MAG TPA: TonB family protein [Pyrinomonadaceae bacterium]
MRKTLTLIVLTLLGASAVAAQTAGAQSGPSFDAPAEVSRLNAEVLKFYRAGKFDEALKLAKRVLELREQTSGADDLSVGYALNNLAAIYRQKGKRGEAEQLLRRSLAIGEKHGGAETDYVADVKSQLGLLQIEGREYNQAGPLLMSALRIKERLHGADSPLLVPVLLNLTDLYFLRDGPEAAFGFLGRAVSILKRQPPRSDPLIAQRLKNYYCPLLGRRDDPVSVELSRNVGNAIWRLEKPEEAARFEAQQKEREERKARGELTEVEGGVLNGRAIRKPAPSYPSRAKEARVMGTVVVQILVNEMGKVIKAEPVCGHPLLAEAAVDAARGARFTPTLLSGMPVKVSGVITYTFVLQ